MEMDVPMAAPICKLRPGAGAGNFFFFLIASFGMISRSGIVVLNNLCSC
jgi:hypothetical protein